MKKHLRRRFKACFHQMLAGEQLLAIHEPALGSLMAAFTLGEQLDRPGVAAALSMASGDPPTTQMVGNVAVLPIFGVLSQKSNWLTRALGWTATQTLERDFDEAIANAQVKAVIFYVDSPGGTAIGNEEVSKKIFAARGKKPIYAFVRGICASAAYYLASAAQQIVASPSSTVGSIGAVSTHIEYSKALADEGIGVNVIRSAPHKQLQNPYEKLSAEGKAEMQKWVGAYGDQFEKAVARYRGVSQASVKAKFGQGDAFLAAEAAQRGMIDGVVAWEQVIAKVQSGGPLPATGDDDGSDPTIARTQANNPTSQFVVVGQQMSTAANFSTADGTLAPGWSPALEAAFQQASGSSAAASAAVSPSSPPAAGNHNTMKVSARVRAALFARGFISAQDSDDALCMVALGAYFAARGESCPQNSDKSGLDDDKVVSALFAVNGSAPATAAIIPPATPATGAAPNVQAAHDREIAEARQQFRTQENSRRKAIQASGKLLNIPAAQIEAAIDGNQTHETVIAAWHGELVKQNPPVTQDATVTGEGADRFAADAVLALQCRMDRVSKADQPKVTDHVRQLSNAPLSYFARQSLAAANVKVPEFLSNEELMEVAFGMDGMSRVTVGANYSAYNRPGSFPNLLSNLANKILDVALELNEPTYAEWSGAWANDLPDFKPAAVVAKSQHDELDEILDAEASKEFGLAEEMIGMMVLRRFSNKFVLTPVMAANDDLNAFDEGLLGLEMAWQNTINRACLRILTGNVTLLDGNALYDDATHGNDISGGNGGGVPSDAQWDKMNLKVAAQTGVGGKGFIRTPLKVALMAPKVFRAATQALGDFRIIGETKVSTQDSNVNIYRGSVTLVREPELQAFSSDVWYGFCQARGMVNASVVRAYFRGWGKNGRRQRWYDPETKCWNFELEGRVGAAAKSFRHTVRNNGVN